MDGILHESIYTEYHVKNNYLNLEKLIGGYKEKIERADRKGYSLRDDNQYYKENITFKGVNSYYKIIWDIKKANSLVEQFVKQYGLKTQPVPVSVLMENVQKKELDKKRLDYARKNNNPPIVIKYRPTEEIMVIDGNHRVFVNYEDDPLKHINVYYFEDTHLNFMVGDIHRVLYAVHQNLTSILNYKFGLTNVEQLKNLLINGTDSLEWMDNFFK